MQIIPLHVRTCSIKSYYKVKSVVQDKMATRMATVMKANLTYFRTLLVTFNAFNWDIPQMWISRCDMFYWNVLWHSYGLLQSWALYMCPLLYVYGLEVYKVWTLWSIVVECMNINIIITDTHTRRAWKCFIDKHK